MWRDESKYHRLVTHVCCIRTKSSLFTGPNGPHQDSRHNVPQLHAYEVAFRSVARTRDYDDEDTRPRTAKRRVRTSTMHRLVASCGQRLADVAMVTHGTALGAALTVDPEYGSVSVSISEARI